MSWWGLLWLPVITISTAGQLWLQRYLLRRSLRAGRAPVSVRGTTPAFEEWPPRWRGHWVTRDDAGRLVTRRATDHESTPGVVLLAPAGSGRPLPGRERHRVVVGARRAVPVHSSAGLVEVAARAQVLDWLLAELPDAT